MSGEVIGSALALVAYALIANVAIALVPHEPAVIVAGGTLGVALTVVAASVGTALAAYLDHRLFAGMLQRRARPEGLARWLLERFERAPSAVLAASGMLPVPTWPFKVAALTVGLSRWRYVAALTAGRVPRYALLAAFGSALSLPTPVLVAISVGFGAVMGIGPLMRRFKMAKDNNQKAQRMTDGLTARWEKENLPRMAAALPAWVTPDHLTVLGLVAAVVIAAGYVLSSFSPAWLLLVVVGLFFHWLGDSLDGTLARVRKQTRERYGYYVDRTADAISTVLIGVAFGLSPYVHLSVAMLMTISYLLLQIYAEICAYTAREFPLSFGHLGPTEARIALALFTVLMMFLPPASVVVAGLNVTWVDGVVLCVSAGLFVTFAVSSWRQARRLDVLDRQQWKLATESGTGFPQIRD